MADRLARVDTDSGWSHVPQLFPADLLGALALPIGEDRLPAQSVALGGRDLGFERPGSAEAVAAALQARPRTRIYEGMNTGPNWTNFATTALRALADRNVVCTVYESQADDETLGSHYDNWHGAIVQQIGTKQWRLGGDADPDDPSAQPTLTLKAGDLLWLPRGVLHDVTTPPGGHSVHLGFAFLLRPDEHSLVPREGQTPDLHS